MIADANTVAVVARDVRQPVGFAVMTFGDERAHLVLLAVRPSHQRQGIARRALAWLLESAATAGMISVHVELRAANSAAYALYGDAGFTETFACLAITGAAKRRCGRSRAARAWRHCRRGGRRRSTGADGAPLRRVEEVDRPRDLPAHHLA